MPINLFANEKPLCRCEHGLFSFVDSEIEKTAINPQNTRNCMAVLFYPTNRPDKKYIFFEIEYTYNRESLYVELCKIQNRKTDSFNDKLLNLSFDDVKNNLSFYVHSMYNRVVMEQLNIPYLKYSWHRIAVKYNGSTFTQKENRLPTALYDNHIKTHSMNYYVYEGNEPCYSVLRDIIGNKTFRLLKNKIKNVIIEVLNYYKNYPMSMCNKAKIGAL